MAELHIETPDGAERTVALAGKAVTMGRADECDVVLSEQKASRKHCRVEPRGGAWRVVDEGSSNGTWLGGKPVLAARLKSGDAIEIGETVITFADDASEPPPPRRPRAKMKPTPWGALFIPVVVAAAAFGLVLKFDKSEGAAASAAMVRQAKAEIEGASFEKDAGKRTARLAALRDALDTRHDADAALALVDAAVAGPAADAGHGAAKDDWHAEIDAFDAEKSASPSQRRARLVDLFDRHMDDAAALAAIRDRFRAELMASGARVRLDRDQTFADADKAAEDGRYGVALTLWTSWVQRAPSVTPEDDAAIAARIADLLAKSRADAEEAAKVFEAARLEGRGDAARAALEAAAERLRGTGFDAWLEARGGAATVRRTGPRTGPDKTDDAATRERNRALQIASVAEQLARQRRFDDAAAKLDEAAGAVSDAALKGVFAARAADVRSESAFLGRLLGWVAADPKKFGTLKLGEHVVRVAGASPTEVSIFDKDNNPEAHSVADVPANWFTQLVEKAGLEKAEFVPAALFLHEIFEEDGYVRWMRAALSDTDDASRLAASAVHARCLNRPTPPGGFMPHPEDSKSIVTYEEYKAIKNAKEIARLRADLLKVVADVEKSRQAKAIETVRRAYLKLEEARKYALDLIFDEIKYFYPYRGTGREAEYAKVQHEVDERVKAVRDAWDDKTKATIRPDASMDALVAKADKLVTDIAYLGGVADDLVERIAHVTMYIVKESYGTHDAPPAKKDSATHDVPAGKDADVSLGRDLTVQNFFENQKDLDLLIYNARVMKYNPGVKGPTDPERQQVVVTNEYRMMFGHRRALRIQPKLVNSARGHSEDMAKLGFFDHFSPVEGKKTPEDRMKLAGYEMAGCSENIYMGSGSPEAAHEGWIHSSGHHRNILTPAWVEMGSGNSGGHWTQNFGFQMTDEWDSPTTPK